MVHLLPYINIIMVFPRLPGSVRPKFRTKLSMMASKHETDYYFDVEGATNSTDDGEDDEQQSSSTIGEEQGILGSNRYTEERDPVNLRTQLNKEATNEVIFTINSPNIRRRPTHAHIPTSYSVSNSDDDIDHTTSELTGVADLELSTSSIFTDHNSHRSSQADSTSGDRIESLDKPPSAVLYLIPKEYRGAAWIFLDGYTGLMNTVAPCAILLADATSEYFEGCVLTALSWDKYGVDYMHPENRRTMFNGESVSHIPTTVLSTILSWLNWVTQTLIPSNHDPWSFMQCLFSKSLITLAPNQPNPEQEDIFTQQAQALSLRRLDRPTMAKYHFMESAELIWMAWNLLMHSILRGDWDDTDMMIVHHVNTMCNERRILCREISDWLSDRLFRVDVMEMLEVDVFEFWSHSLMNENETFMGFGRVETSLP
jgi:hypothetical protein